MKQWQKFVLVALVFGGIPLLMAQTGPTVFTPRLTVSPGPLTVTTGLTTVQDITINGTCTGCPTSAPGGSDTQVQFNNAGAFGGDAGFTYVSGTDTASIGVMLAGNGTVSAPSIGFANDTDTGFFRDTANEMDWTVGGTQIATANASALTMLGLQPLLIRAPAATALIGFQDSTPTLVSQIGESSGTFLIQKTNGNMQIQSDTGNIALATPSGQTSVGLLVASANFSGILGSASSPTLTFTSDPDSGVFRAAANGVGIAGNGAENARIDSSSTAGQTRLLIFDVDNNTLERVSVDAADSCGAGFKCLRIPN